MAFPAAFVLGMVTAWCPDTCDSVALCIRTKTVSFHRSGNTYFLAIDVLAVSWTSYCTV